MGRRTRTGGDGAVLVNRLVVIIVGWSEGFVDVALFTVFVTRVGERANSFAPWVTAATTPFFVGGVRSGGTCGEDWAKLVALRAAAYRQSAMLSGSADVK